jgi:hypothetical protein
LECYSDLNHAPMLPRSAKPSSRAVNWQPRSSFVAGSGITDNEKAREFALTILGWHSADVPPAPAKTRRRRRPA